jgi:hypothetical protein
VGYIVSSLIAIGEDDQHQSFVYYVPSRRFTYKWINDWIYQRFYEVAARFGPNAVLIAPPPGKGYDRDTPLTNVFFDALTWRDDADWGDDWREREREEERREESTSFLHSDLPFLIVSRRPVRPSDNLAPFAAIHLASLDEAKLALLFDSLIEAINEGVDLLDRVPDLGHVLATDDPSDSYGLDRAIEIKPSIFGIGLNGNVVLEWLRRRHDRRDEEKKIISVEGKTPK